MFTAPSWCIPCRRFEPHWDKAKSRLAHLDLVKVDLGKDPDIREHWATRRWGIRAVPTVKYFYGGTTQNVDIKARAVVPFIKEVLS